MKRLAFVAIGLLAVVILVATGCSAPSVPPPGEVVSTCVICHSDEDLLKEVATPEEKETSEETTGEG